ncbi:MAG: hypothetical protein CBB65_03905 [Hyphomonadaceae bacterium TMED5]|nr:nucleoside-diphosphate sugar epimerase [Ponticaulis sp.]OUY00590.1 MAG: hypothetical protein CBB65_03905 [Hyphomonadaceae bacterium TMED5]|tara:strand:- start:53525 stop:54799 length:1275 start_codon:yes stop_codon:yes gene_type:complete
MQVHIGKPKGFSLTLRPTDLLTKRTHSLLRQDMTSNVVALTSALTGKSCLVIGGAGSIGSETLALLSGYPLSCLLVVDQDENGLARLMRRLRGAPETPAVSDIETLPMDYGSAAFQAGLKQRGPFDFVLNFAALKHVRSEKQPLSIFNMMDTNILKQARLLETLNTLSPDYRYFSVSTDKAANPVSFMGATKRVMEHVMFLTARTVSHIPNVSSARFANVAYSQGSLLESFITRLENDTPLAAPLGIERFFFTLQEAGEFCLLSGVLGEPDTIYVPSLSPEEHLVSMEDAAIGFLRANGYEPRHYPLEQQASAFKDLPDLKKQGLWPVILTPANTAGEKPYEEFVGETETASTGKFSALLDVAYDASLSKEKLAAFLGQLQTFSLSPDALCELTMDELKDWISDLEPSFQSSHIAASAKLDDRI